MSSEQNKALVLQFLNGVKEVLKGGDFAASVEKLVARDYVSHDPVSGEGDFESFETEVKALRDAFPDMDWRIDDAVAEGDKVATRETYRATHQGEFMGIKPTGKQVTFTGTHMFRLKGGKIVETWFNGDYLGLMQQLGVIPPLGQDEE